MGNVIEVPSIWKFYYKQIQGEYYQSKEKLIEGLLIESKLYRPNLTNRPIDELIDYKAQRLSSKKYRLEILPVILKIILIPFVLILQPFKIRKWIINIFCFSSKEYQDVFEFERLLYKNSKKELVLFLNNSLTSPSSDSLKEFLKSLHPDEKKLTAKQTILFLRIFDSHSFLLKGTIGEQKIKLRALTGLTEDSFKTALSETNDLMRIIIESKESYKKEPIISEKKWESLKVDFDSISKLVKDAKDVEKLKGIEILLYSRVKSK